MANSSSSESSSTSDSDYSDFDAAMEEEINETVEPFGEIKFICHEHEQRRNLSLQWRSEP